MGYWHYWTPGKAWTDEDWRAFGLLAGETFAAAKGEGLKVGAMTVTDDLIDFTCYSDYHSDWIEGARIQRVYLKNQEGWDDVDWRGWKVKHDEPSDIMLTALLCIVHVKFRDYLGVSSDADGWWWWQDGYALALKVLPNMPPMKEIFRGFRGFD